MVKHLRNIKKGIFNCLLLSESKRKASEMVITVFVFGNPLIEEDSLALKVAESLKGKIAGIEFKAVDSLDEVENKQDLYIMDVAFGLEKVQAIENLESLETKNPVSGHDFDLAIELKLLKKLGRIGKVSIIAIPAKMEIKKAVEEVKALVKIIV